VKISKRASRERDQRSSQDQQSARRTPLLAARPTRVCALLTPRARARCSHALLAAPRSHACPRQPAARLASRCLGLGLAFSLFHSCVEVGEKNEDLDWYARVGILDAGVISSFHFPFFFSFKKTS
jgi:hypothetical protein